MLRGRIERAGLAAGGAAIFAVAVGLACGCAEGFKIEWPKAPPPPEAPPAPEKPASAVLADTIGSQVVLAGAGPLRVRGFGLVVGLGDQGSTECPTPLRAYLAEYLTKTFRLDASGPQDEISVTRLIDSPDTAPVEVIGLMPPGAPRGTTFDVFVQAAAGTQTRSLEGGLLLPCELKIVDLSYRGDRLIAGRTAARAGGPVFTDPRSPDDPGSTRDADPRRAIVLGGGQALEPRNVRLVLAQPSYSDARRIERRINERFGQSPRTAEAMSKAYVEVRTPPGYADDPMRFARLVAHVYLFNEPAFFDAKLADLAAVAEQPNPPYDDLALAWEGIGRVGLQRIQPLYGHADPLVGFAACQAGLRLDDPVALEVMARFAADAGHPRRLEAVGELGRSRLAQAAAALVPLLDVEDPTVRIAAYEALLRHRHPAVDSRRFVSALDPLAVNVWLDCVKSAGRPLVYVRQSGEPRIALFGPQTPCRLPLFYAHPDGVVTLNALHSDDDITLFRRLRGSPRVSDPLYVPPRVADLLASLADVPARDEHGRYRGVGLNYAQTVQVLAALCEREIIPATLVRQPAPALEWLATESLPERPESAEREAVPPDDAPPPPSLEPSSAPAVERPGGPRE